MLAATALSTCRPAGLTAPRRAARPARRSQLTTRAMAPVEILQLAADAAPGTVDAPFGAIIIGAVVVTGLSFALTLALKPGTDAAIEMQQRDQRKFNKYDKK